MPTQSSSSGAMKRQPTNRPSASSAGVTGSRIKQNVRGRPRRYDREFALDQAMRLFWRQGYLATSLDDISKATHMHRPSLYAAFGSKEDLFVCTLEHYRRMVHEVVSSIARTSERDLIDSIRALFESLIGIYTPAESDIRGCYILRNTPDSMGASKVRGIARCAFGEFDKLFRKLAESVVARGDLSQRDVEILTDLARTTLHSVAVSAMLGATRHELSEIVETVLLRSCRELLRRRQARRRLA